MSQSRSTFIAAVVLWILCGVYATQFIYRGWIPHDEGTIGQTAERVLAGQVPHRDFDDMYTGGLTYLHAAGMKILGVNLRTPRLIVFVFWMAFLAATYTIGRRVASPVGGLVAMAMAAVWSLPNYFVGLPSWYNLFFATFGVLAFIRYLEHRHRTWLVLAGVCGGLSILFKISGVFYLAGGVLFLTYLGQNQGVGLRRRPIVDGAAVIFLILLARTLLVRDPAGGVLGLFLPAVIVSLFIVWRERGLELHSVAERLRALWALQWPFLSGAAMPMVIYVAWFASQHAFDDLIRGMFILPQRRLGESSVNPLPLPALLLGLPYVFLLTSGLRRVIAREATLAAVLTAVFAIALALAGYPPVFRTIWALAFAMPMAVVTVAMFAALNRQTATEMVNRPQVFLLVAMAAMLALIQFPYATPIYFCYAAPMTILAILAVVFAQPSPPKRAHLAVAAFFFAFAVVFVNQSYAWNVGVRFLPYHPESELELVRGGLRVSTADKQTYEDVVRLLRQHAAGGTIYAGPDCPEIYFLSGFPNRTRAIFDFLSPTSIDESAMSAMLADGSIRAVVVNTAPLFSPKIDPAVLQLIEARFPSSQQIGRFIVRFK